jgi:hypothetical protein
MKYKYDITLSFAGEDREYVEKVATLLKENNIKIFYDKFEEAELWGKDLGLHFDTVYRKSAKYCIPFISCHYKEKIWTNYEIRNIISRAIENNEEYILPARFDDTEIEGIRPTLGYIDLRNNSPEELVNKILKKLGSAKSIPISEKFQEKRNDMIRTSIQHSFFAGSFGIQSGEPTITIKITNKLKGDYRYFYEPTFKVTIPLNEYEDGFNLTDLEGKIKYPIKLEYGEEFEIKYELSSSQKDVWNQFEELCEFYAVCSTTIGEKFESNKNKISTVKNAFEH